MTGSHIFLCAQCIQDSHQNLECEAEDLPLTQLYPDVGPKVRTCTPLEPFHGCRKWGIKSDIFKAGFISEKVTRGGEPHI